MPLPVCKYDPKCYQKNEDHFKKYSHPSRDKAAVVAGSPKKKTWVQPSLSFSVKPEERFARDSTVTSSSSTIADKGSPKKAASAKSPVKAPSKSPGPSRKRPRDEDEDDDVEDSAHIALPAPRPSPLQGPDIAAVFEMPYPMEEIHVILNIAKDLKPSDPCKAFDGVRLIGPFQVALGHKYGSDAEKWTHWRRRFDPPEVQTMFVEDTDAEDSHHFCYHRDSPDHLPTMVVKGSNNSCKFSIVSTSLPVALMDACVKGSKGYSELAKKVSLTPANSTAGAVKARNRAVIAKTVSGLGIAVPYVKKTELGYRDPMFSTGHFMGLVNALNKDKLTPKQQEDLYEQFRFADIANDEFDFGLSLELGLNMLTLVNRRNAVSANTIRILDTAYMLLGRDLFRHILACHIPLLMFPKEERPTEFPTGPCDAKPPTKPKTPLKPMPSKEEKASEGAEKSPSGSRGKPLVL